MLILDIPRKSPHSGSFVEIPVYHRPHLSIASTRNVHLCLLPNQSIRGATSMDPAVPELLVSPFPFEAWDRLWRIEATLKDRPGILHDIAEILQHHNACILASESGTSQEEGIHSIEMLVDIQSVDQIAHLEWTLGVQFFSDVAFSTADGRARLSIHPVQTLHRAKHQYELLSGRQHALSDSLATFKPIKSIAPVEVNTATPLSRSFRLRLPKEIKNIIKLCVSGPLPYRKRPDFGYHVRMSDTKDRFLRVLFLKSSDPVIHARIECRNESGALTHVTRAIRDSGLNILSSFISPMPSARVRLEVVIRAIVPITEGTPEIKRKVETQLAQLPKEFEIRIGYPDSYGITWDSAPLESQQGAVQAIEEDKVFFGRLHHKMRTFSDQLSMDLKEGLLEPNDRNRLVFMHEIERKYELATGGHPKSVLFVSCHYTLDQLSLIKQRASEVGFQVVTAEDLFLDPTLRDGVVRRMSTCSHFLGVWSITGAVQVAEQSWPSPWHIWEAGVAQAFGLTTSFLIAKSIADNAWQKVYPERQVVRFTEVDFENKLSAVLSALFRRPGSAYRVGLGNNRTLLSLA